LKKKHTYQVANTSDISIENKINICQAARTSYIYIRIYHKIGTCQAANTSDVSIENKAHIYQAANTFDISIVNKTHTYQAANTFDISIEKRYVSVKQLTHLMLV
jgi:hypothetical protein